MDDIIAFKDENHEINLSLHYIQVLQHAQYMGAKLKTFNDNFIKNLYLDMENEKLIIEFDYKTKDEEYICLSNWQHILTYIKVI